jgi:hypothetical protein
MALSLTNFRRATNGFAKRHHFSVGFADWKGVGLEGPLVSKVVGALASPFLSTFCSAMEMPTRAYNTHEISIQHGVPPIKIANDVKYNDWTITFYSDEALIIRYFLLNWMNLINNTSGHEYSVSSKYKSNLAFGAVLSPQDIPVQVYSFRGLYPTSVGGIQMTQTDTGILTFDVTFTYDFFQVNEPLGMGLAFGLEKLTDRQAGGSSASRKLNLPFDTKIKTPF